MRRHVAVIVVICGLAATFATRKDRSTNTKSQN